MLYNVIKNIEEMKDYSPEEFERIMKLANELGPECRHECADELMCKVLEHIGYAKGVDIFKNMIKWYA